MDCAKRHDTKPNDPLKGVLFIRVKHDPERCLQCKEAFEKRLVSFLKTRSKCPKQVLDIIKMFYLDDRIEGEINFSLHLWFKYHFENKTLLNKYLEYESKYLREMELWRVWEEDVWTFPFDGLQGEIEAKNELNKFEQPCCGVGGVGIGHF
jgi:hypothetical protein